ncbi:haloacid dehalogenase-like hydrolase domain-containing protein 3 [Callorhinchus milii]|uniref:Haloacid dehalogenase-like hydrolase domain-containing protein 3 n=1 Tax=Callorhinchus milii TaxID=7868 RepID=V9L731_CALMI|nr:haloacid dehalogenase-like hydrolase domain-containing protein 3 [Callorhinchus milii]XP_042193520.1 haloacid dehalogenase-like hydrolase domain-containing protein 3 [Callorhinchus milii]XP_042193521.1 haloacid dehalogenase-like hydrolase domain-containing protein 3 [Callorhinchus milii]|eukprot:gi/632964409/ref/XP_007898385.1/ PREDICTED: haloacid dehalogenase-like hydrolase domain-containing protein 3 [Callorhinchus milii]
MRLHLLTWDVKDTLLRARRPVGDLYSSEARKHGVQVKAEDLNKSFAEAYRTQRKSFPNYGLAQGLSSKQWWVDTVKQTFRLCGVSEDRVLSPVAEKLYRDFASAGNWETFADVKGALDHCNKLGIRMGVISNFDRRLEQVLSSCELRHYFEFVLTSEDVGVTKPDQRIFRAALEMARVEPPQAAHIGDDVRKDYLAARSVGMNGFLIRRDDEALDVEGVVPRVHILHSLQQLCNILE